MRINLTVLAAFLCYAAAPAATCGPQDQLGLISEPEWPLVVGPGTTTSGAMAAPNTTSQSALPLPQGTVNALPVTSTAPDHEPESGLR